jgi:hypothetical protein
LQAELVLGTESWLNDQVNSAVVFPEGYTVFRRDRQRGSGGGVFILVSSKFDSSEPVRINRVLPFKQYFHIRNKC